MTQAQRKNQDNQTTHRTLETLIITDNFSQYDHENAGDVDNLPVHATLSESDLQERLSAVMAKTKFRKPAGKSTFKSLATQVSAIQRDISGGAIDATSELKNCNEHGKYIAKLIVKLKGNQIYNGCPECAKIDCERVSAQARRNAAARSQDYFDEAFKRTGIPDLYLNKGFESIDFLKENGETNQQLLDAISIFKVFADDFDRLMRTGGFLVAWGSVGTGKTLLANAVAQQVMKKHTVLYLLANDIIRSIRDTWAKDQEKLESQVLRELASVDLLVIDEIGVQFGTESEQNHLFEVINRRVLDLKPTILVTNLPPRSDNPKHKTLQSYIGIRSYDRLREVVIKAVPFIWESYRGRGCDNGL